jgi:hypothetical protein
MDFLPGEHVVWRRLPHTPGGIQHIDVEVVQPGPIRVRIRIHQADGRAALRWVKPQNLYRLTDVAHERAPAQARGGSV